MACCGTPSTTSPSRPAACGSSRAASAWARAASGMAARSRSIRPAIDPCRPAGTTSWRRRPAAYRARSGSTSLRSRPSTHSDDWSCARAAPAMLVDVSPTVDSTDVVPGGDYQSVSGKALCIACSADGRQVYLGGHSGVWRSSDFGGTWRHSEWPQPPPGQSNVPGALLVPNVYDLLVSPTAPGVVLAATGRDAR